MEFIVTTQFEKSRHVADDGLPAESRWRAGFGADLGASLVVFLVALPLCVGVAVASGVPAELGIVTGVVGGLVVGLLPGSTFQVSGPEAAMIALVAGVVSEQGPGALGVIVLGAGLLQIVMGLSGVGSWFRAISPSVVQGMLAGIGLVLVLGQVYVVGGLAQPAQTLDKLAGLPGLVITAFTTPSGLAGVMIAVVTLAVMVAWQRVPQRMRLVPGALVAVVVASAMTFLLGVPLKTIKVGSLLDALNPPDFQVSGAWSTPAVLGSILTFGLIASAASLCSASAVDRMHDGTRTNYNKELLAQGAGNAVCGLLGALPMTAVIVRSATNVQAGAKTKLSRVLHGVWLLLFVVLLPGMLDFIPTAVLAALLIHAGWKLLEVKQVVALVREHRSEAAVLVLTAVMIVATDLLIGTVVGLAAAILKAAVELSRLSVKAEHADSHVRVEVGGNATFLRLPRLVDHLDRLPTGKRVHVDLTSVRYLDRASEQAVTQWAAQRRRRNCPVEVKMPARWADTCSVGGAG
jgi:MFS superfamily sulfate permease-like transporter